MDGITVRREQHTADRLSLLLGGKTKPRVLQALVAGPAESYGELSNRTGLSKSAIREAVDQLAEAAIVYVQTHRGHSVIALAKERIGLVEELLKLGAPTISMPPIHDEMSAADLDATRRYFEQPTGVRVVASEVEPGAGGLEVTRSAWEGRPPID